MWSEGKLKDQKKAVRRKSGHRRNITFDYRGPSWNTGVV